MAALREIYDLTVLVALLLGSLVGFVVGLGLLFRTQATIRFFGVVNRWISTRLALKPLEVPRSVEPQEAKHRWIAGAIFTVGGTYAVVTLFDKMSVPAEVFVGSGAGLLSLIVFDSIRWFLLVACVAAAMIGVMLLFFPASWSKLEAQASRWYSTRQLLARGDLMHYPLDRLVEASPRVAGVLITVLSVVAVAAFAILLHLH